MIATLRRALPNSPFLPAALAFLLATTLVFAYARGHNYNFTAFVRAGMPLAIPHDLPPNFVIRPKGDHGHDGQFYYRLSLNPFTSTQTANGILLDAPAYRHQRVFYPFVVWCLSLGQKALVPFVMVAVNVFAWTLLGLLGGLWARKFNIHAIWGVLLALHPGFLISLWLNLTEISEVALLCAALLALRHKKNWLCAVLLSLAVLTKETALLFAVAGALVWLWERRRIASERTLEPVVWMLPVGVYITWQVIIFALWHQWGATSGTGNLGMPFVGIFATFLHVVYHRPEEAGWATLVGAQLLAIALLTFVVAYRLRRAFIAPLAKVSWLLYVVLAMCLSSAVWSLEVNFTRALSEYSMLGLLVVLAQSSWRMRAVIGLAMLSFIASRAYFVLAIL